MTTRKELIRDYKKSLKAWSRSGERMNKLFWNDMVDLLRAGKKDKALELVESCPCDVFRIGARNTIVFQDNEYLAKLNKQKGRI